MASTEPLTGVTVQDQNDAATGGTQIGNLAKSIAAFTVPRFATTTARDAAYTAKVAAGGFTMAAGLVCTVAGVLQEYTGSTYGWRPLRDRIISRDHTPVSSGIGSGAFRESGVNDGPTIAAFTIYRPSRLLIVATFRVGQFTAGTGSPLPSVKVDGVTVADGVVRYADSSVTLHAIRDVTAGSHTVALRVDAFGGDAQWINGRVTITEGVAE